MLSMRENKEKIYSSGILLSIVLIFFDAYEIFSIPISWIGMALLALLTLFEFKTMFSKNQKQILFYILLVILIPQLFFLYFFQADNSQIIYLILRIFNIVSFALVLMFSVNYFKGVNITSFIKNSKYVIYMFSSLTLYIFAAQIYDLFEPYRNRSNTNYFHDSEQSIFWLSEPHRAMGTFREPVLLITFLLPLVLIYLYKNNEKIYFISFFSGIALGLSRSNYLKIFCLVILIYTLINYFLTKEIKKQLFVFVLTAFAFSTFGVLECNLNQDSVECLEYEEDINKIINRDSVIDSNDLDESVVDIGNDRLNVLRYFLTSLNDVRPTSFLEINTDLQKYSSVEINEEMYFSNRTLPKYLLERYSTKNFGTGNYSLTEYGINFQNLFVFYTKALGILFPLLLFLFSMHFLTKQKINLETSFFLLFILFFFIGPVEEVNSYYGLIIGLTYNLFINKEFVNEKI